MPRFISMKNFATKKIQLTCQTENRPIPVGRVLGVVHEIETKTGALPTGEVKESKIAHGEFQSVNLDTGEVLEAMSIYLPKYFAEAIERHMRVAKVQTVPFAIEIDCRPTGATIPFAYEVRNLLKKPVDHPLEQMKRALLASGESLKGLPAPVQNVPQLSYTNAVPAIEAPADTADVPPPADPADADPGDEFAEGNETSAATAATHKAKRSAKA